MNYNANIVLNANGSSEIRNAFIERIDQAAETALVSQLTAAHVGRIIFNTTDKVYKFWAGSSFSAMGAGGGDATAVQAELDRLETALGNFINADGTFTPTALDALLAIDISAATSLADVLVKLDQAITAVDKTAQINALQTEVDAIETGAGLAANGNYIADNTTNYIQTAASLADADKKLDTQIKANADAIAAIVIPDVSTLATKAEVNTVKTGAGLETDGTYVAPTGTNYLGTATSLKNADVVLDTQIKTTNDAVAALTTTVNGKQDSLGYTPANKAGDTINGNFTFDGTSTVKNIAAPTEANDAVRKIDLDNAVAGITRDFQPDVLGFESDYTNVPGRYIYVDGSKFIGGEVAAANDIVEVNGSGQVNQIDFDASVEGPGALAWNTAGVTWLKWDGTTWSSFGGMDGVNAGVGLSKVGNTLNVNLGAGIADLPTGEVGIDLKVNGGLQLVDPTSGSASSATDAVLSAKVTGALELVANGIQVKAAGVTATELATSVAGNGLQGGGGTALSVKAGTGIVVDGTGVSVDATALSNTYLAKAGGTMTGPIVLAADAAAAMNPTTLQQMQAADTVNANALSAAVTTIDGKFTQVVNSLNKTYYTQTYTNTGATAAISVAHNLGVKYCNVTIVDSNDEVFVPQTIKFVDANNLTINLNSDISGTVIVMGHATLTLS